MKRAIFSILLTVLLLSGCHSEAGHTTAQTTVATQPAPIAYLRDNGNSIEELTQGAVEAYTLENRSVIGIRFFGDRLLAFTTADHVELTTILVLGGEDLGVLQSTTLDCALSPEHLMVSTDGSTFSYYHMLENSLVMLDANLLEIKRIQLPDQVTDRPLLTTDLSTAYYSSSNRIYALDLATGLSRLIKEHSCLSQHLTALHFNDTVMEVLLTMDDGQTQVAFISPENGQTTGIDKELLTLVSSEDNFLLRRLDGSITETLVGLAGGELKAVDPQVGQNVFPAFSLNAIAGVHNSTVSLYDLTSGKVTSRVELGADVLVLEADSDPSGNSLWLRVLDQQNNKPLLLRWMVAQTKTSGSTQFIHKRYTAADPDTKGLALCQQRADAIASSAGFSLQVTGEFPVVDGYEYVYEHQVTALNSALDTLEKALTALPPEFLTELASVNQSGVVRIGLVRDILDVTGQSSSDMGGVHRFNADGHYIILAINQPLEEALYHQLSHLLDSYVIVRIDHFDKWESLNPKSFAYANTFDFKPDPDEPLLQGDTQLFVSAYGMSFANEDRATIFAASLQPDNESLFALPGMQKKLQYLCTAIRHAYGWKETELQLPWEQYLKTE